MAPINLTDFREGAQERMPREAWDYIEGGAGDEVTLRANRDAFERLYLRPRMLIDVSTVDTSTTILGTTISFPVLIAPTGFQTLAHPDGELATAAAAADIDTIMVVSTLASHRLEDVQAAAPGPKWFQLYCYRERGVTQRLVERAEEHGYRAICLTVDVPRIGRRERDVRNAFAMPPHAVPRNFEDATDLSAVARGAEGPALAAYVASLLDGSLTWDAFRWLRSITSLPLLIKGILTGADARLAVDAGADGVVVSNHGGRQLDGAIPAIAALPEVVDAVGSQVDVLVDGGIRRGTDVVKALAMGAVAVQVGRPVLWGLGAAGRSGAHDVLDLLRDEVELAMALCGCPDVRGITADLLADNAP